MLGVVYPFEFWPTPSTQRDELARQGRLVRHHSIHGTPVSRPSSRQLSATRGAFFKSSERYGC